MEQIHHESSKYIKPHLQGVYLAIVAEGMLLAIKLFDEGLLLKMGYSVDFLPKEGVEPSRVLKPTGF
jgi:hypothetical protein